MNSKVILKSIVLSTLIFTISGCLGGDSKEDTNKQTVSTTQSESEKDSTTSTQNGDTLSQTTEEANTTKPTNVTTTTNPTVTDVATTEDNVTTQIQEDNTTIDNNTTTQIEEVNTTTVTNTTTETTKPQTDSITLSSPNTQILKYNNTTLTIKDKKGNDITNNITWIVNPTNGIKPTNTNTITPIQDTTITLKAKYNNITSNPITLHVKWIVNGHILPPKPDEKINNSTLLGIDTNNNGVRDDVERKIYQTYKRPIERAYMMQGAKIYPKTLINPRKMAKSKELERENWNLYSCQGYLFMKLDIEMPDDSVDFMESAYFNTKERIRAYLEFNDESSGGVYNIPIKDDNKIENCDFNVTKLLELEK